MAVVFTSGFETGNLTEWTGSSGPPTVVTSPVSAGTYAMKSDISSAAQYAYHDYATEPSVAVFRLFFNITGTGSVSAVSSLCEVATAGDTDGCTFQMVTDGSGNPSVRAQLWDGVGTFNSTATATLSTSTWYRLDAKIDMTAAAWKVTFGIATGSGSLTTVVTDFTGGTEGAGTANRFALGQFQLDAGRVIVYDDVALANTAGEYPLGPSGQTLLPDADVTTTGWTTAPLYSKLNDSSDATIITATAA